VIWFTRSSLQNQGFEVGKVGGCTFQNVGENWIPIASSIKLRYFSEANPVLTILMLIFSPIDGLVSLMSFKRNQVVTVDYEHKRN